MASEWERMTAWTRQHDRLIAEVAEGWKDDRKISGYWVDKTGFRHLFPQSYETDSASVLRAYEAWRAKDVENRLISVEIFEDCSHTVKLRDYAKQRGPVGVYTEPLFIDALRWALWQACGGKA